MPSHEDPHLAADVVSPGTKRAIVRAMRQIAPALEHRNWQPLVGCQGESLPMAKACESQAMVGCSGVNHPMTKTKTATPCDRFMDILSYA